MIALTRVKLISVPPSSAACIHIRPPLASMIVRQIERPRPMPSGFVLTKAVNSLSPISGVTPGPPSATTTCTQPDGPGRLDTARPRTGQSALARPEERRVGKEGVRQVRYRGARHH